MTLRHQSLPMLVVASGLGVGCVPDFDTDLSQLKEPRLLAIAATPAETQAEKPFTLTALIASPDEAEVPNVAWTMCLSRKPLTELGPVNPVCLAPDDGSGKVVDLGRGLTATGTLDRDVCKLFGPLRPSPMGDEGAGRPADPDITGGFYQPFAARFGDTTSLGSVRLDCDLANVSRDDITTYRKRYRVNENPRISELAIVGHDARPLSDGDPQPAVLRAGARTPLRATWNECSDESQCGDGLCTSGEDQTNCAADCTGTLRGCTGAEPYVWYNREKERIEPRREGISVAWYASRGHFENEQTGLDETQAASASFTDNTYVASNDPGPVTIWVVIRDTRGGVSWQIRHLEVAP